MVLVITMGWSSPVAAQIELSANAFVTTAIYPEPTGNFDYDVMFVASAKSLATF